MDLLTATEASSAQARCDALDEVTDCFCCGADLIVPNSVGLNIEFDVHARVSQRASHVAMNTVCDDTFHPPEA
jgi:hypothetical protein